MTITRTIDGKQYTFELTYSEMQQAYREELELVRRADVESAFEYLQEFMDDDKREWIENSLDEAYRNYASRLDYDDEWFFVLEHIFDAIWENHQTEERICKEAAQ